MEIARGLQPNHSEWMRLVALFADEETAKKAHQDLLQHLQEIFTRAKRFPCAAFYRYFASKEEFEAWKAEEWDPIADERCTLKVEKKDGRLYVHGDYGLILDDWSPDDVGVALDSFIIAIKTYTAGYGMDHLEQWLSDIGGDVHVEIEQSEFDFQPLEAARRKVQAAAGKKRPDSVRVENRNGDPAGSSGD